MTYPISLSTIQFYVQRIDQRLDAILPKPGDVVLSAQEAETLKLLTHDLHEMHCGDINEYTGEKMTCDACQIVAILEGKMGAK